MEKTTTIKPNGLEDIKARISSLPKPLIGVIVIGIIFIPCFCCCILLSLMSSGGEKRINRNKDDNSSYQNKTTPIPTSAPSSTNVPSPTNTPTPTKIPTPTPTKISEIIINISEQYLKNINEISKILGNPKSNNINDLPMFSQIIWDSNDYNFYVDYKKDENIFYGGLFYFKKTSCNYTSDNKISENDALEAIKKLGFNDIKLTKDNTGFYFSNDTWDIVNIKCKSDNTIYVNLLGNGYINWSTE